LAASNRRDEKVGIRVLLLLAPLLGLAPVAVAQEYPAVFKGPISGSAKPFTEGPLQGLHYGDVIDPAGRRFKGLLPSSPNASPVGAKDRAAIAAFIEGYKDGTQRPLKPFLAKDVTFLNCRRQGQPCQGGGPSITANTPYRMTDGTVRIEWLYGSALYYISALTLRSGKIISVKTAPAWAPIVIP
jgi:hypothetical protein